MSKGIYGNIDLYAKALDAAWARNAEIANNIANVDTPGYKRKDVVFEEYLKEAIEAKRIRGYRTNARHIPVGAGGIKDVKIRVIQDNSTLSMRLDGNNVDIDSEAVLAAENSIYYNTIAQKLSGDFRKLRTVINEGRR